MLILHSVILALSRRTVHDFIQSSSISIGSSVGTPRIILNWSSIRCHIGRLAESYFKLCRSDDHEFLCNAFLLLLHPPVEESLLLLLFISTHDILQRRALVPLVLSEEL